MLVHLCSQPSSVLSQLFTLRFRESVKVQKGLHQAEHVVVDKGRVVLEVCVYQPALVKLDDVSFDPEKTTQVHQNGVHTPCRTRAS